MIILQIHNRYLIRGGEDESREAEARLLAANGHRVVEYIRDNTEIDRSRLWLMGLRSIWSPQTYREVCALIQREKPDIALIHNFFPLVSPSVYDACRKHGVPIVQYLRNYRLFCLSGLFYRDGNVCELCAGRLLYLPGIRHRCYRAGVASSIVLASMLIVHRMLGTWRRKVDRFIAISQFCAAKCVALGLPRERVLIKPNFMCPDPGIGDGSGNYILFVGRIAPEKGLATLLRAWRSMATPPPLRIIGTGPDMSVLQAQTRDVNGIEWLGNRSSGETLEYMGHALAIVMPSECYETFGRVVMEAAAKGTPAIVSRLGAMTELIDEGKTGWFFPAGDAVALADRIAEIHAMSADRRLVIRRAVRARFEAHYSAEANLKMLTAIIEPLVSGPRHPDNKDSQ